MKWFENGFLSRPIVSGRELLAYSALSMMASNLLMTWFSRHDWVNAVYAPFLAFAAVPLTVLLCAIALAEWRS